MEPTLTAEDLDRLESGFRRYRRADIPTATLNALIAAARRALELEVEIERLRAALIEIERYCPATSEMTAAHIMADIARQALPPPPQDTGESGG